MARRDVPDETAEARRPDTISIKRESYDILFRTFKFYRMRKALLFIAMCTVFACCGKVSDDD